VSLRGRLAIAFTVILLAPMVLGSATLAGLTSVPWGSADRGAQPRDAATAVVSARCRQLAATAAGLATSAAAAGQAWAVTPEGSPGPWALCGVDPSRLDPLLTIGRVPPTALAARAEIRGEGGTVTGYAYALQPIDAGFLAELSSAAGGTVSVLAPAADDGRTAQQPLRLAFPEPEPVTSRWPLLIAAIGVALVAAALLGVWLASLATRPLRQLLATAERVSRGDLAARTAVDGSDETGRLGRRLDELIVGMQEAQRLSLTDPLTGLGNRRHLVEQLHVEVERADRFGRTLGVLMLDLDHFKAINDRYGHRVGDAVLVEFAARVRRAVREVDLVFRHGGEEFVVLLPETDLVGCLTAAERIGAAVRDVAFPLPGPVRGVPAGLRVTVSVGAAVFPQHGRSPGELLEAADEALYAAKGAGRDCCVLATDRELSPATSRLAG